MSSSDNVEVSGMHNAPRVDVWTWLRRYWRKHFWPFPWTNRKETTGTDSLGGIRQRDALLPNRLAVNIQ